jgi:glycosyltransferase involved in cell wall biosynthesis
MISIVTPWAGNTGLSLLPDYIAATLGAELILVDNGSDPETADALRELPPDRGTLIRNETNLGFAAANNQGYAAATGDVIVFLNSDIAGDPSWLKLVADDVQDGALYGPSVNQQLVYGLWLPYIEGWCVAATRTTWDRLIEEQKPYYVTPEYPGPWDAESYPGPYWEDNDLCFRALELGISLTHTAWPIQHKGGRTAGAIVKHGATFEANRATFVRRVKPVWERMQER